MMADRKPRRDVFVTGTDTGIGKTWVSAGIMRGLVASGHTVAGMKPVASGCRRTRDGWRNDDAELLQSLASADCAYEQVNPVALPEPVAPHIAAARSGMTIDTDRIMGAWHSLRSTFDSVVVEGVGGWRVPLLGSDSVAHLARRLELPVVMVVGLRLGCINHALLTAEAIASDGVNFAGWIATGVTAEYGEREEIVNFLCERIAAPLVGVVPHMEILRPDLVAEHLSLGLLPGA